MKSKVVIFAFLAIFLVGLVLAAGTFSITFPSTVSLSDSDNSTTFTITNTGTSSLDLTLPGSVTITDDEGKTVTINLNQTAFTLANSESATIEATVQTTPIDDDFGLGTFSKTITLDVTNGTSDTETIKFEFENTFCESGDIGDLRIKDVDFDVTGYSDDDEEWYLLDEVEVIVEVKNDGNDDIDDVELEWGLYNTKTGEFVIDDDEKDQDIDEGDREEWVFEFDVDPDDFDEDDNENDFVFYVKAFSDKEGEDVQCASDEVDIKIVLNQDFVILTDVEMPETALPGETIQISADVWNIGDDEQEEVKVIVTSSALKLEREIDIGDIDPLDDDSFSFSFTVPNDINPGVYPIKFEVEDEDGDIFESDDDEKSSFSIGLRIGGEGSGSTGTNDVEISASLDSDAAPGEELIVSAIITNTGDSRTTYQIVLTNFNDWATLESIEPRSFTLDSGDSEQVIISLTPNSDATGSNEFTLQVVFEGMVEEQRISVPLGGVSIGTGLITGSVIGDSINDNWFIWLIVLLNVVLVILIIIVAVKMARKS